MAGRGAAGRDPGWPATARDDAARDPPAGRRPGGVPGCGRRGLPAVAGGGPGQRPIRRGHDDLAPVGAARGPGPARGLAPAQPAARTTDAPPIPQDDPLSLPRRWGADAEIDLSPGVPDLSAFPRAAWLRAERAVLAEASPADLGYGDPRGNEPLRAALAGWLARTRGLRTSPEAIVVTAGVAQALALLAQTLRARGHTRIAVENPGSRGTRDELAHWGLARFRSPWTPTASTSPTWPAPGSRRCDHPGPPVPDRGGAVPGTPPGPAGLGGRRRPDHRGRLRRRIPLRPGPGPGPAQFGRRAGSPTRAACPRPWPRACGWAG